MGMGVGQDPLYFCERGYYLEYERAMLRDFREQGFKFGPEVLDPEKSIDFLVKRCRVKQYQAELRVRRCDLIIMEYIPGIPLATQTGYGLNCDLNVDAFCADVVEEMHSALRALELKLMEANAKLLLHNDPMPPNIIFSMNEHHDIIARLVDFELGQNIKKGSPDYVNSTVAELYRDRHVPVDPITHDHIKNLDNHLMDGSIDVVRRVKEAVRKPGDDDSLIDAVSIGVSLFGSMTFNLGKAIKILRRRANS